MKLNIITQSWRDVMLKKFRIKLNTIVETETGDVRNFYSTVILLKWWYKTTLQAF